MKTMTCRQMGGSCDSNIVAGTPEEMKQMGISHIEKNHPEIAESLRLMSTEENKAWEENFMNNWKSAPNS